MENAKPLKTPFKGLVPYADTEADASLFFGRDAEQEIIRANLMSSRLTVFYGPTGVGKSSVLNAGVVYPLREQTRRQLGEHEWPDFCVVVFRNWRDADPAGELAKCVGETLEGELGASLPELAARAGGGPGALPAPGDPLSLTLKKLTDALNLDLFIILDQFEEYFVYHPQEEGGQTFAAEFPQAVNDRSTRAYFLISIREEWVAKLDRFKGALPSIFENNLRLKHLGRDAAEAAIFKPLEVYRTAAGAAPQTIGIPRAVAEEVLDDLQRYGGDAGLGEGGLGDVPPESAPATPGGLIQAPFLQLLMQQLWEEQQSRDGSHLLQLATLEELGGVGGVRRTYVKKKMALLTPAEREAAAACFRFLVTASGSKYAQPVSNLVEWSGIDAAQLAPVLDKLCGEEFNLLRRADAREAADPRYEVVHDMLAPAIHEWASEHNLALKLARLRREEKQRERARRLRLGFAGLAAVTILMGGMTVFAIQQRSEAVRLLAESNELRKKEYIQRTKAEAKELIAKEEAEKAAAARGEAEREREEAEKQRVIADEQRQLAEESAAEATRERRRAEAAQAEANYLAETERINRRGLAAIRAGRIDDALKLFRQAGERYQEKRDFSGKASALSNLAEGYTVRGGVPTASVMDLLVESKDFGAEPGLSRVSASDFIEFILSDLGARAKEQSLKEMGIGREAATRFYKDALEAYAHSKNKEDDKDEGLALKRLGDIVMMESSFLVGNSVNATVPADKLQEAVTFYERAAKSFGRAGEHAERAKALRLAAFTLSSRFKKEGSESEAEDPSREPAEVNRVTDLYEQSRAAYEEAGDPLKAASVSYELGEFYRQLPDSFAGRDAAAIRAYRAAHDRLNGLSRPDLEAKTARNIAEVYAERAEKARDAADKSRDLREALSFYDTALRAYIRANEPGVTEENLFGDELAVLKTLADLFENTDEGRRRADAYFWKLVNSQEPRVQTRLLKDLRQYQRSTKGAKYDDAMVVKYYSLEWQGWEALDKFDEAAMVLFELGQRHAAGNDKDRAVEALDHALADRRRHLARARPGDASAGLMLGWVAAAAETYEKLGEPEKAIDAYTTVFDENLKNTASSDTLNLMQSLAALHLRTPGGAARAREVVERTLAAFRKSSSNARIEARVLTAAGKVFGDAGDIERAREYYDLVRAKGGAPEDILVPLRELAKLYVERGRRAEALAYLNGVVEAAVAARDPRAEAPAHEVLGDLRRDAGEYEPAVEEYERAAAAYGRARQSFAPEMRVLNEIIRLHRRAGNEAKVREVTARRDALTSTPP